MDFFRKSKYKIQKKVQLKMANIIYQNKKSNIYDKRIMN